MRAADELLRERADAYARVALANAQREFPYHEPLLATGPEPAPRPRERHPAFYGSFDWHSCVEMHWVLVRLLRTVPGHVPEPDVRALLDRHLTEKNLAAEARWFADPARRTFERPYGWGWALRLVAEVEGWDDPDALRWTAALRPLADVLVDRCLGWLPDATYPVRHGVHANGAFGLSLALPFARARDDRLLAAFEEAARRWFGNDARYPAEWEPSGTDFLSPALTEAELMASLLERDDFAHWLGSFLPGIEAGEPRSIFEPAHVSDATDPQIAHLHGLNLSRAWCWRRLAETLPEDDPRVPPIRTAAERHAAASLDHAVGSDYAVEHWLVAYAVLLLS